MKIQLTRTGSTVWADDGRVIQTPTDDEAWEWFEDNG